LRERERERDTQKDSHDSERQKHDKFQNFVARHFFVCTANVMQIKSNAGMQVLQKMQSNAKVMQSNAK
jgi:hypothetical protein